MNLLKQSFKILKQKIPILLSLDILFFTLIFFFLIYIREKMKSYILALQTYTPQILTIQSTLKESATQVTELESLLTAISPLLQKAFILQYIITPIILFLLWCIFQSLIWREISSQKNYKNYLLKFSILSIPIFLLTFLLFYKLGQLTTTTLLLSSISIIILFYFTILSYSLLQEKTLKNCIKKAFNLGIKKIYILAPLYLLFLLLTSILIISFFSLYVIYLSNMLTITSSLSYLTTLIILIITMLWLKIIITLILKK